jgi:U3 small nucleolar RNA-associated protein 6
VNLFNLATRKFPSSLSLWRHYIAYVLTQSSPKLVSRALAAAISLHPANPEFWMMAARWEADGNEQGAGGGNVDGARKLLLRALRFNKASETIWLEWLRIEVSFAERLRKRWEVLGIGPSAASESPKPEGETVVVPSLEGEENGEQVVAGLPESAGLTGQQSLIEGVLVKLVLDNAFKCSSRYICDRHDADSPRSIVFVVHIWPRAPLHPFSRISSATFAARACLFVTF